METREIVKLLTDLRKATETEAEASCLEIETTFAHALADVCESLYLGPTQTREILGQEAFSAVYSQAIPVTLPETDPWAELRAKVRATFAKSTNVHIVDDPTAPAEAFEQAFCLGE